MTNAKGGATTKKFKNLWFSRIEVEMHCVSSTGICEARVNGRSMVFGLFVVRNSLKEIVSPAKPDLNFV